MIENLKEIKSSPITGKETLRELLKKSFTAHLSRDFRDNAEDRFRKNKEYLNKKFELSDLSDLLIFLFSYLYIMKRI